MEHEKRETIRKQILLSVTSVNKNDKSMIHHVMKGHKNIDIRQSIVSPVFIRKAES